MTLRKFRFLWLHRNPFAGPAAMAIGATLLVVQVLAFYQRGLLSAWLIGGGIGLLAVGAMATVSAWEDSRASRLPGTINGEEMPSADEYDRIYAANQAENDAPSRRDDYSSS